MKTSSNIFIINIVLELFLQFWFVLCFSRSASSIVDEELRRLGGESTGLPKPVNLIRAANLHRQKDRAPEPATLDFELSLQHIPSNFLREDIKVEDRRHLLFSTDRQLELLKGAKRWYVDGTFDVSISTFTN